MTGPQTPAQTVGAAGWQRPVFDVDARLVRAGVTLVAVGSAMSAVGGLVVAAALGLAARRWVRAQEVPPSELAARRMAQLRAALAAGTNEWRQQEASVHPAADPATYGQ